MRTSNVNHQTMYTCDSIKGCRNLHSIKFIDVGDVNKLLKRILACFYYFYLDSNYTKCVNLAWVGAWDLKVLIPKNYGYVRSAIEAIVIKDEWDQFGECGEYLASCLELGDHFTINANKGNIKGVDFYLILYTQVVHIVEKDFTCQWGIAFKAWDVVVRRKYYQKCGVGEGSYVFLKKIPIIFMHVAHVRAIKFLMLASGHRVQSNDLIYTLYDYFLVGIKQVIVALDLDSD